MYKSGHKGINMILFSPILFIMIILDFIIVGLLSAFIIFYFASLPDKDLDTRLLTHRGFTHTYSFSICIGILFGFISLIFTNISINIGLLEPTLFNLIFFTFWGVFVGVFTILGHIAGDILTPTGVKIFQKPKGIPDLPIFKDKKYTLDLIPASNTWANAGFFISGILCISLSIFTGIYINILI